MKCRKNTFIFILLVLLLLLLLPKHDHAFGAVALNVVGELTHKLNLEPGARIKGEIRVENQGDEAGEVKIYLADYLHYADGRNLFQKPGTVGRSNAPWFTLSPSQSVIQPKATLNVNYSITVPADPKLKGTYWSLIMIEPVPKELVTPPATDDINMQVVTVIRQAVQMVTNIGKGGEAKVAFKDRQLVKEDGRRLLKLDIENTGEKFLAPHVWAELFDAKGQSSGQIDGSTSRIYPGCSVRFEMDMTKLPAGSYKAVVVADNGDENVFGANYTLDLK